MQIPPFPMQMSRASIEMDWLCQVSGNGWWRDKDFPLVAFLGHSDLRDQRTPACKKEAPLHRQRDVGFTAAADTEVLP